MIENIANFSANILASTGYIGLFIGLALNSVGIPIFPSEILLPTAGILAAQNRFNIIVVIIIAIAAQIIGLSVGYFIASRGGIYLVKKYGKYVFFSERELNITQRWFKHHGELIVIFATTLPVLKAYIGYPAGLAQMKRNRFLLSALAGTTIWTITFVLLGYYMFDKLDIIEMYIQKFSIVIIAIIFILIGYYLYRRIKSKS